MTLSNSLFSYLNSQIKYINDNDDNQKIWNILDGKIKDFLSLNLNEKYSKYIGEIIPLLSCKLRDDYILEHNGKYILVHDSYPDIGWAIENIQIFNTPQEVWEQVIKPDIEAYYDN